MHFPGFGWWAEPEYLPWKPGAGLVLVLVSGWAWIGGLGFEFSAKRLHPRLAPTRRAVAKVNPSDVLVFIVEISNLDGTRSLSLRTSPQKGCINGRSSNPDPGQPPTNLP